METDMSNKTGFLVAGGIIGFSTFAIWLARSKYVISAVVLALGLFSGQAAATPSVFDDFDGPAGSPPNPNLWDYDVWGPGPGKELQTYTNSTNNVYLDGQGHLVIAALKSGNNYTSGRLVTRGKLAMTYGTMSASIKLPAGQGIHPAFWMLGTNMDTVGWPQCGEIDVAEIFGDPTHYTLTVIGPSTQEPLGHVQFNGGIADLSQGFHTYWVTREQGRITEGVDSATLATFTPASMPPGMQWVFDNQPMYGLLNVAVGGADLIGPSDASTPFPAAMVVDWFRYTPQG
jgi:beta-glucanase (GH16 family)